MEWSTVFILAQASSGFADFFEQIPTGLIVMFCGSALALVVFGFLIVRARAQRTPAPESPVSRAVRATANSALEDLPDLDLLVSAAPAAPAPKSTPPAPARSMRKDTYQVRLTNGETTQAVEVVNIMRDVVDGGLIIQMGDKIYRDLTQDETFRSTFLKIMRELSPVVSQATSRKTGPLQAPAEPARTETAQAVADEPAEELPSLRDFLSPDTEEAPEPPKQPVAAPKRPASAGPMPGDLPRYSLDDQPQVVKKPGRLLGRQKTEFVPVPELNLAGAIEAYLQHKLQRTPDYDGRSIHVHPAPDGGVSIEVDGTLYDTVGEVSDSEVRAFLVETIQEWQERNTGKG